MLGWGAEFQNGKGNLSQGVSLESAQNKGIADRRKIDGSESLMQLSDQAQSEGSLESDDIIMIHSELNKLQDQFQKDAAMYEHINAQLLQECQGLRKQAEEVLSFPSLRL
ncbi:PACT_coil_coil domain-containing protein [Trichonephila clavipes]|nr:PACT_coil_coil domain-containing protein [Trichonephila clavipes]